MIFFAVLFAFITGSAFADQLQLEMPVGLAARVIAGPTWDGAVTLEPKDALSVRVTVEARLRGGSWQTASPSQGDKPFPEATSVERLLPLPKELAGLQKASPWEKLVGTVLWVSRHVRLVEDDRGLQDAASVLARRVGRCSGRANLAVALLRQMGVPARVVHGLLLRPDGAVWHRWGEACLPNAGWRPFDPGVAVGAVGVRYLPIVGADESVSLAGLKVVSVAEWEFLHLPRVQGLRVALPRFVPPFLAAWGKEGL
ncbi:MAG: transglutaminase-like domain-containing protein [Acidobacteriota bacterium]